MASDSADGPRAGADTAVTVVERSHGIELRVDYDGSRPPLDLFDRWRALGWAPPVPQPPPAQAIDWTRPDPARGTRYTLLPFSATGVAVLPALCEDGPRRVAEALRVTARLGCRVVGAGPDRATTDRAEGRRAGTTETVRVSALVPSPRADEAVGRVCSIGAVSIEEVSATQLIRYRGQVSEAVVRSVRVDVDVPSVDAERAVEVLAQISSSRPSVARLGW